jgi:RNA recognition motif-containing protein
MKLYVGNLPNSMTEEELTSEFKEFGEIQSLKIITDRETGRSRGFGFIEMPDNAGRKAIQELNETDMQGRQITVNEAQERKPNNRRNY